MLCGRVSSPPTHCARSLLENRDRLVENVKGGLDSAKELLPPLGGEATSQQLLRRCFPARLQHAGGSGADSMLHHRRLPIAVPSPACHPAPHADLEITVQDLSVHL
jgi:hypothetical protein